MQSSDRQFSALYRRAIDRIQRVSKRRLLGSTAALLVILLLITSVHVRVALKSAGFFIEIFPDMPAYPLRWFTGEPNRQLIAFSHGDDIVDAYLYSPPAGGCHAGLVMYIGVGDEYDDPHLDRASRALARNGIAVVIPVSEALTDYRLTEDEHEYAVSAFQYLQGRDSIHPERVGFFGISVGGAIVANAAQERSINQEVALVHSMGGYYDAFDLLASVALEQHFVDGEWVEWEPSDVTIRVIRNSILPALPEEDYEELWHLMTDREDEIPDDLTDEGLALARVMVNREPERVPALLADLPSEVTALMEQISPAYGIERLEAPTLLLHDVHDEVLPYSESIRFYESVEAAERKHLTLLQVFHHVRPDEDGGYVELVRDGLRLYGHVFRIHRPLDGRGWFVGVADLVPGISSASTC
jgi:dienelactone hydrolase